MALSSPAGPDKFDEMLAHYKKFREESPEMFEFGLKDMKILADSIDNDPETAQDLFPGWKTEDIRRLVKALGVELEE